MDGTWDVEVVSVLQGDRPEKRGVSLLDATCWMFPLLIDQCRGSGLQDLIPKRVTPVFHGANDIMQRQAQFGQLVDDTGRRIGVCHSRRCWTRVGTRPLDPRRFKRLVSECGHDPVTGGRGSSLRDAKRR